MEIRAHDPYERSRYYTKKLTLKDGTVKEYRYEKKYTTTSTRVRCGKAEIKKRIDLCKDKAKIERIKQLIDEIGV